MIWKCWNDLGYPNRWRDNYCFLSLDLSSSIPLSINVSAPWTKKSKLYRSLFSTNFVESNEFQNLIYASFSFLVVVGLCNSYKLNKLNKLRRLHTRKKSYVALKKKNLLQILSMEEWTWKFIYFIYSHAYPCPCWAHNTPSIDWHHCLYYQSLSWNLLIY